MDEVISAGRELSRGEILAFMTMCQKDRNKNAGTRDAAIIALMYAAGLRRREVVNLVLPAFDKETGVLLVIGKHQKERIVYLVNGAAAAMADWLKIRGTDGEPLFVEINKVGKLDTSKYLTSEAIYIMLTRRAQEAGIQNFSPHDLRQTFISHLWEAGANIATVAKLAGRANIPMALREEKARRKAAELLHVPYKRSQENLEEGSSQVSDRRY